jgi:hypothetical protein
MSDAHDLTTVTGEASAAARRETVAARRRAGPERGNSPLSDSDVERDGGRIISMESNSTMTFEPDNGGTRVTFDVSSRLTIPLIGRFLDSFLERGVLKNIEWTTRQLEMRHAKKEAAAT